LAWLVIIKGVEWFVRNTPPRLHVQRLFLKPTEVGSMCRAHGLGAMELPGMRPRFGWPFWRMLLTRRVSATFAFKFARSTRLGFSGCARKTG
jgi:2-polyprenyl-6-hydroxyphenyl methylase/3-demethylubiquinone-9 3-methyltransferase